MIKQHLKSVANRIKKTIAKPIEFISPAIHSTWNQHPQKVLAIAAVVLAVAGLASFTGANRTESQVGTQKLSANSFSTQSATTGSASEVSLSKNSGRKSSSSQSTPKSGTTTDPASKNTSNGATSANVLRATMDTTLKFSTNSITIDQNHQYVQATVSAPGGSVMPIPQMVFTDGVSSRLLYVGSGPKSSYQFEISRAYPGATGWRTINFTSQNYSGSLRVYLAEVPTLTVTQGPLVTTPAIGTVTFTTTFHVDGNTVIGNPVMNMWLSSDLGCTSGSIMNMTPTYTGPRDYSLTCIRNLDNPGQGFFIRVGVNGNFSGGASLVYFARMP